MVDLFKAAGAVRRRLGAGLGQRLGGAPVRRRAHLRVPRDPMDLNKWWIRSRRRAPSGADSALAWVSASAARPFADARFCEFRVIPWT